MTTAVAYDIVIPSVRPALLRRNLAALITGEGTWPERVFVVDDRPVAHAPLLDGLLLDGLTEPLTGRVQELRSSGRGPAAARNVGWRAGRAPWVAFLDDDVVPRPGWRAALARDLVAMPSDAGGSQGRIQVPMPADRRPTDRERSVAGLEGARWATADMAYRREALTAVGGLDERFPRAYREDADLAARVRAAGYQLCVGTRVVDHPVGGAPWWISVANQAGNADDMLMRRLYGRRWREIAETGPGLAWRHAAVSGAGLLALAGWIPGIRRHGALGATAGLVWLAGVTSFAAGRIRSGPRTVGELVVMGMTSAAIPPAATWHRARGWLRARRLVPADVPAAVLFDRDGTLVDDVPYNGEPADVVVVPGAREALDRLRVAGIPTAVVTNQSGVARRLLSVDQVAAVNGRVEELLGPLGPWLVCPHGPDDGCQCRKPLPGLIEQAAAALGVEPRRCVVIGDIAADLEAAERAGARAILVPNGATRPEEVEAAAEVAGDLGEAVDLLIGPRP